MSLDTLKFFLSGSIDGELVELLRVPALVLDGVDVEVLVGSVDQVHEVTEASGHVVGGETEPGTA